MVQANGGEVDTSNPGPTRHEVAPSVQGSYHSTANYLGAIVEQSTHSALQAALLNEREDLSRGMKPSASLDVDTIQEHVGLLSGRAISENWHGDSAFAPNLAAMASAIGPPSVYTQDPRTGAVFSARTIPSSKNHHNYNNRLNPLPATQQTATSVAAAPRANLFPFGKPQPASSSTASLPKRNPSAITHPVVTTQKKSRPDYSAPSQEDVDRALLSTLDATIDMLDQKPATKLPSKPKELESVDMGFMTNNTPINRSIQNNPSAAFASGGELDDDLVQLEKGAYINDLIERCLARSFTETNVASKVYNVDSNEEETDDTRDKAIKRVNMILDNREKAEQLTELFVDEVQKTKAAVNSPALNKMLDNFMG